MANIRPNWPDALDPIIRKYYGDELKQLSPMAMSIFHVESSSKQNEKDSSATGLSKLVETAEGAAIANENMLEEYDVTYTHRKFTGSTTVTQEMWEDDQNNQMKRGSVELARAKTRTIEAMASDIFNYGFTAGGGGRAAFTAGDAAALFSASHTRIDGGANQNNTTTADLAEDSLETALLAMQAQLDGKGQLIDVAGDTLLIPPALEKEARILLNSTQRVGTANNDINPYNGALTIKVWKYLGSANSGGSDTGWFILDSNVHRLNWFNRSDRGLEGPEWNFFTKSVTWSLVCRWSVGFSGWLGTYGSTGTNA